MGNTVPPRMCRDAGTAVVGRRRPNPNSVVPVPETVAAPPTAAPRRVAVATARRHDEEAVVTVKIVLKRKDAEALVARLNAQSARERKVRMAELNRGLRAGDGVVGGCGGGGAIPASCRDAWRPRLEPIQEN